jgi:hypothetical protein
MQSKRDPLTRDAAEAVAAQGFAFLAREPAQLSRFLALTGIDVGDVRRQAGTPEFLGAVLEYLTRDESLLLVFAENASVAPETVAAALDVLQGPRWERSEA